MDFKTDVVTIDGMHCDACVRRVTTALGKVPGVRVLHVEVGSASVVAEPACEPKIREAISEAGFSVNAIQQTHAAS